jgi:hypothetical protein
LRDLERGDSDGIRERSIDRLSVFFWNYRGVNDHAESGRREWIAANN